VNGTIRLAVGGVCALTGAALLLSSASISLRGWYWQEHHAGLFVASQSPAAPAVGFRRPPQAPPPPVHGEALAHLRVPRLGIGPVLVEGTAARGLRLGPGHLEGSALPGEPDNCIIAGHRDGPFRLLGSARPGDIVEIADRTRVSRYRIESIETVPKGDLRPLSPSSEPVLTLITCFPFRYVGKAPNRFIVRASLLEVAREEPVRRSSAEAGPETLAGFRPAP